MLAISRIEVYTAPNLTLPTSSICSSQVPVSIYYVRICKGNSIHRYVSYNYMFKACKCWCKWKCVSAIWSVYLPVVIQYNIRWQSYVRIVVYDQSNDVVPEKNCKTHRNCNAYTTYWGCQGVLEFKAKTAEQRQWDGQGTWAICSLRYKSTLLYSQQIQSKSMLLNGSLHIAE